CCDRLTHAGGCLTTGEQPSGIRRGILQGHLRGGGAERPEPEHDGEDDDRQRHGEFCDSRAQLTTCSHPAPHSTERARRTRSVRMSRTSSDRMMTTRSPANATAAIVVMAYSAVAAPVSSAKSSIARRRVKAGRGYVFMMFLSLWMGRGRCG